MTADLHSTDKKTALITGSTSGIGKQIAISLASAGHRIVLHGIDHPDVAEKARQEVLEAGAPDVVISASNLFEPNAVPELINLPYEYFGTLDILVNNAGIQHVTPIEAFSDANWDRIIELNLSAPFRLIRGVLPGMRKNGWGRIINIASVHGLVASINKSAYIAAKHGLIGLTKAVAVETAKQHITCNAICPGYVRTPLLETQIDALAKTQGLDKPTAVQSFIKEKQPTEEFVTPSDIAAMAAFLCSDAASQITGSSLTIDGGWTAQ